VDNRQVDVQKSGHIKLPTEKNNIPEDIYHIAVIMPKYKNIDKSLIIRYIKI
jgi:hypothetical protein